MSSVYCGLRASVQKCESLSISLTAENIELQGLKTKKLKKSYLKKTLTIDDLKEGEFFIQQTGGNSRTTGGRETFCCTLHKNRTFLTRF